MLTAIPPELLIKRPKKAYRFQSPRGFFDGRIPIDFGQNHRYARAGNRIHTQTSLGTCIDFDYDRNGALTRLTRNQEPQFDWERAGARN